MAYQTILVHLPNAKRAGQLLEVATRLARQNKAFVIGLFAFPQIFIPPAVAAEAWADILKIQSERYTQDEAEVKKLFSDACAKAKLKSEWRSVDPSAVAIDAIVRHAFCADLVVVPQADPDAEDFRQQEEINERVLMETGRPALFVPYVGRYKSIGEHPIVAWTATRESARAAYDALPFLKDAETVTIMTVNPADNGHETTASTASQFAVTLARHGVRAKATNTVSGDVSVSNELLSRASDHGADLIVMGGYGHSRFRETVFGGVTHDILHHMTVPVLMSH